jgi:hypothetical protein
MPPKIVPLALGILIIASSQIIAQQKLLSGSPTASPTATPTPRPLSPQQQQKVQEIAEKLQERTGNAAGKVFGAIQKQEGEVYLKFVYFLKPERLDPNSFASKDEITEWRKLLQDLKEKEATLETSYTNADLDLGTALIQQQISPPAAMQIKKTLLASFPWDAIKAKSQLMHEFLAEHSDLLDFFDQNWDSWKPGKEAHTAAFDNPDLAGKYDGLKNKITATSDQLKDKYQAMVK